MITPKRIAEIREALNCVRVGGIPGYYAQLAKDLLIALDAVTEERDCQEACLKATRDTWYSGLTKERDAARYQLDKLRKWCADNDLIPNYEQLNDTQRAVDERMGR